MESRMKILRTPPEGYHSNPFDFDDYPQCWDGYQYAVDVVDGKIPACIFVRGACIRFLNMIKVPSDVWYFDAKVAERYLRLVQKFFHAKGKWKTKNIVYSPWQKWGWMNIIGFIRKETGYRLFRTAHWEVPRGNAKSTMAAQAVLYFLALDGESVGNEIATFATKKEQARLVLDAARSMAKKNVDFLKAKGIRVMQHSIVQEKTDSKARSLASNSSGLDGLQDILAVLDELHAMARNTYDTISSGMSKRGDSLMLCITTAGDDVESVGASQSFYSKKLCLGEIEDDTFFGVVYTIDEGDDIYDPFTWEKANPGWHDSIDKINFRSKAMQTKEIAANLPGFKIKHLNMWISEANAYFDVEKFKKCADPTLKLSDFYGMPCRMAADMADKLDLTSVVYLFKKQGIYYFFDKTYLPRGTFEDKNKKNDLYFQAEKDGHLIITPGNSIDQDIVEEEFKWAFKKFRVDSSAFDPWNSRNLMNRLAKEGHNVLEFGMKVGNLSGATKELQSLIVNSKVRYNGSPLATWCVGNVVCKEDAAANVFPKKSHPKLKIDIAIAKIMALATLLQEEESSSIYEDRAPIFF